MDFMDQHSQSLINFLASHIRPERYQKMCAVVAQRTRYITVVLEDIVQEHNASAVVRSAEIFGIQSLHTIQQQKSFTVTESVALGAAQWLDISQYTTTAQCYTRLKSQGYTIVGTAFSPQAISLYALPLDRPCALVFGTEHTGLSQYALEHADIHMMIPMYGFTQSFNISVSVALTLQQSIRVLQQSSYIWQLSYTEQQELLLSWLRSSIRGSAVLEREFLEAIDNNTLNF
jgi:tRNA (guanosine-2'-O-)-methyltransferase